MNNASLDVGCVEDDQGSICMCVVRQVSVCMLSGKYLYVWCQGSICMYVVGEVSVSMLSGKYL
jgi:hypothetical protein